MRSLSCRRRRTRRAKSCRTSGRAYWPLRWTRSDEMRCVSPSFTLSSKWTRLTPSWIPERSATRLREADLNVFSKLGNQGLEGRLEPEAFTGREVRREDDLLDFLVGYPVDIEMARQPST